MYDSLHVNNTRIAYIIKTLYTFHIMLSHYNIRPNINAWVDDIEDRYLSQSQKVFIKKLSIKHGIDKLNSTSDIINWIVNIDRLFELELRKYLTIKRK